MNCTVYSGVMGRGKPMYALVLREVSDTRLSQVIVSSNLRNDHDRVSDCTQRGRTRPNAVELQCYRKQLIHTLPVYHYKCYFVHFCPTKLYRYPDAQEFICIWRCHWRYRYRRCCRSRFRRVPYRVPYLLRPQTPPVVCRRDLPRRLGKSERG